MGPADLSTSCGHLRSLEQRVMARHEGPGQRIDGLAAQRAFGSAGPIPLACQRLARSWSSCPRARDGTRMFRIYPRRSSSAPWRRNSVGANRRKVAPSQARSKGRAIQRWRARCASSSPASSVGGRAYRAKLCRRSYEGNHRRATFDASSPGAECALGKDCAAQCWTRPPSRGTFLDDLVGETAMTPSQFQTSTKKTGRRLLTAIMRPTPFCRAAKAEAGGVARVPQPRSRRDGRGVLAKHAEKCAYRTVTRPSPICVRRITR